jgi:hypothetical protein
MRGTDACACVEAPGRGAHLLAAVLYPACNAALQSVVGRVVAGSLPQPVSQRASLSQAAPPGCAYLQYSFHIRWAGMSGSNSANCKQVRRGGWQGRWMDNA